MTWRELAEAKQWSKINYWQIPLAEKIELLNQLDAVVPKKVRGDGLQQYTDYIKADQCSDVDGRQAAELIHMLRRAINRENNGRQELTHPFHRQLEIIDSIFKNVGYLDGYPDCVYYSHKREDWMPLDENLAEKLRTRFNESEFGLYHGTPIDEAYIKRCNADRVLRPWRYSMPTHNYTSIFCEPYTLLWLAGNLFSLIEQARGYVTGLSWSGLRRLDRKFDALLLVDTSIKIGEITELVNWKLTHEGAALEAYNRKEKAGVASAKHSRDMRSKRIESLLSAMEKLAIKNPDIARFGDANLAGIAVTDAKREEPKLWSQGCGQLEDYLSEMRTDSDLRLRYLKIFPKTT